jgi:ribosomal protein L7/L12
VPYYSEAQLSVFVDTIMERLRRIETQLALVSEKVGVPFATADESLPQDVVALVKAGNRLGAIKRYRELTGVSAEEASGVINTI